MKKQTIISTYLLIFGAVLSPAVTAGVFNGKDINVKWEVWDGGSPVTGGTLLGVTDETNVAASDQLNPDIKDFHSTKNTFELWDVDFTGETIALTYTSRYVGDFDNQFMYLSPLGFHFEDAQNNLPDIVNVTVDDRFVPFGFDPKLVSFDADNIYVDLNGAMCHVDGMGSMPDCFNSDSPTSYDNLINLKVEFAEGGVPYPGADYGRIDTFFNWAEQEYAEFFPSHAKSADVIGYYARYYPETNVYVGFKDGGLFIYGQIFGGMQDLGEIEQWYPKAGL